MSDKSNDIKSISAKQRSAHLMINVKANFLRVSVIGHRTRHSDPWQRANHQRIARSPKNFCSWRNSAYMAQLIKDRSNSRREEPSFCVVMQIHVTWYYLVSSVGDVTSAQENTLLHLLSLLWRHCTLYTLHTLQFRMAKSHTWVPSSA